MQLASWLTSYEFVQGIQWPILSTRQVTTDGSCIHENKYPVLTHE